MKKTADLQDVLQRAGSGISSGLGNAGASIKDWYDKIDPEAKKAVLRGLIGAGVGGLATGGMAKMTPHDPEERRPVMGPALLGALLGGTAAAGLPYGLKLLSGDTGIPGLQDRKPAMSRFTDLMAYPIAHHPGATIGLGAGLAGLYGSTDKVPNIVSARQAMFGKGPVPKFRGAASLKSRLAQILDLAKAYGKGSAKSVFDIKHWSKGVPGKGIPAGRLRPPAWE